jgi:hypothetical protein
MQTEAKIFFNFIRGDPLNPLRAQRENKARILGQNMESLMGAKLPLGV